MKTILVPTEHYESMRSTLETALLLARRCDSYMEGFALRFGISEFVAVDMAGGFPLEAFRQEGLEDEKQARQVFESFMLSNSVPRAAGTAGGLSYGWLSDAPEGENFVGSYGRVFDVIVLGRPDASAMRLHNKALESGMFESGRPVLICPPTPPRQIGTNVLLHWNCSTEQARVTALAMPLLEKAERVTVLTVSGGAGVPGPSGDQAVSYLQRNGIAAAAMTVEINGRTTGEAILATAGGLGCDLLIKGAFTQSRLRQMIFGGTTQHILEHAALPVLLAH
ncbi:MAG: universal stress protein [Rhizobiales bacterium]|nr:universal stress protein [Hyphomicrobiales bacterium]